MRHVRSSRAPRAAFTLIEILGVLVILGAASAVILPQMTSRDDQKALAAARILISDLSYAQNRAIAQQKVHYVVFDLTGSGRYRLLDAWSPATLIQHPVNSVPYETVFGTSTGAAAVIKSVQLQAASFDNKTVVAFDVMGIPQSVDPTTGVMTTMNAGKVTLKSGTNTVSVDVAPFSGELSVK